MTRTRLCSSTRQLAAVGVTRQPPPKDASRTSRTHRGTIRRFWVADRSSLGDLTSTHPLLGVHMELPSGRDHVWQADVGTDVCPWLADHKVQGQPILPAAAFAEIAMAAGSEAFGLPARRRVGDATRNRADAAPRRPHPDNDSAAAASPDGTASRRGVLPLHRPTTGRGTRSRKSKSCKRDSAPGNRAAATESSGTEVPPADFYATLRQTGQHHGPAFAALTRIDSAFRRVVADTEITLPDAGPRHPGFPVHPVMLDAALQSMAAAMPERTIAEAAEVSYLPVSFEKIRVFGDVGRHARCQAEVVDLDESGAGKLGTVILTDDAGDLAAELTGIYVRRVERRAMPLPLEQKIFDTAWVHSAASPEGQPLRAPGSWLRADRRHRCQSDG